jgi:hypothetical protein
VRRAAEQAEGPPTNPVEMGLPDIACAVYRASQRPYRAQFENIWGQQAFALGSSGSELVFLTERRGGDVQRVPPALRDYRSAGYVGAEAFSGISNLKILIALELL